MAAREPSQEHECAMQNPIKSLAASDYFYMRALRMRLWRLEKQDSLAHGSAWQRKSEQARESIKSFAITAVRCAQNPPALISDVPLQNKIKTLSGPNVLPYCTNHRSTVQKKTRGFCLCRDGCAAKFTSESTTHEFQSASLTLLTCAPYHFTTRASENERCADHVSNSESSLSPLGE
jgi:hypothetical protein